MKLTNMIRDAYVRAILSDVPTTDYQAQALKLVIEDNIKQLPAALQAIARDEKLSQYLSRRWSHEGIASFQSIGYYTPTKDVKDKVGKLSALSKEQDAVISALHSKVHALAYSVNTRAALLAAAPEFEKYLPADEAKAVRNLPAVQNVVADLVAAGWPKDAKKLKAIK